MIGRLVLLFALAGCGSGGSEEGNNNHGYGFQYDAQGASGVKLRYSSSPPVDPVWTDPARYEAVFAKTEACTGLNAQMPPFIVLTRPGELGDQIVGSYLTNPSLILIQSDSPGILAHELIHHLLQMNTGDPDSGHTSRFFADCAN